MEIPLRALSDRAFVIRFCVIVSQMSFALESPCLFCLFPRTLLPFQIACNILIRFRCTRVEKKSFSCSPTRCLVCALLFEFKYLTFTPTRQSRRSIRKIGVFCRVLFVVFYYNLYTKPYV